MLYSSVEPIVFTKGGRVFFFGGGRFDVWRKVLHLLHCVGVNDRSAGLSYRCGKLFFAAPCLANIWETRKRVGRIGHRRRWPIQYEHNRLEHRACGRRQLCAVEACVRDLSVEPARPIQTLLYPWIWRSTYFQRGPAPTRHTSSSSDE